MLERITSATPFLLTKKAVLTPKKLVAHMLERITSATPFTVIEKVLIAKLIMVIYSFKIRCKRFFHS